MTLTTLVIAIGLYVWIPKGFSRSKTPGSFPARSKPPPTLLSRPWSERQQQVAAVIRRDPDVAYVLSTAGATGISRTTNTGRLFIALKPRDQRKLSAFDIIQRLRRSVTQTPGVNVFFQPVQNITIGGFVSKSQYQYTLQSADTAALYEYAPRLQDILAELPQLRDVTSDLQISNPQLTIDVDRDKARALGIGDDQIRTVLYTRSARAKWPPCSPRPTNSRSSSRPRRVSKGSFGPLQSLSAQHRRPGRAVGLRRHHPPYRRAAAGRPPAATAGGDHLLQSRARRRAQRSG